MPTVIPEHVNAEATAHLHEIDVYAENLDEMQITACVNSLSKLDGISRRHQITVTCTPMEIQILTLLWQKVENLC